MSYYDMLKRRVRSAILVKTFQPGTFITNSAIGMRISEIDPNATLTEFKIHGGGIFKDRSTQEDLLKGAWPRKLQFCFPELGIVEGNFTMVAVHRANDHMGQDAYHFTFASTQASFEAY